MPKERNPVFVAAEKWLIENPVKPDGSKNTIQDWYKASGYNPKENRPLKNRARAGQPPSITYRNYAQEKGAGQRRLARIRESKKLVNSAIRTEAAAQWDELVGDRSKTVKIKNRTYTFEQYLNKEVRDHSRLTKQKATEAVDLEKSLGHGTPTTDTARYAESYTQQFAEDPSGNYASQDYVPSDQTERLRQAGLAGSPEEAAKLHVGTTDIGGRLPDPEIEKVLKEGFNLTTENGAMRLARNTRFVRALPVAGTALSAGLVEINRAARSEEIRQNPNDPTLQINLALDEAAGWADRAALGSLTTGIGAGAAVPLEIISTGASAMSLIIDGGRALIKQMQNPFGNNADQMSEWEKRQKSRMGAY